jgi:excisionase family DNA binding protein
MSSIQVEEVVLRPKIFASEVAEILRRPIKTVYRLAKEGKIPKPRRVGGKLLWDAQELLEFLAVREASDATANT